MKLLVTTYAQLIKTENGSYWVKSTYDYNFYKRYLKVFENVRLVARVKTCDNIGEDYLKVNGPGLEIFEIPFLKENNTKKKLMNLFPK